MKLTVPYTLHPTPYSLQLLLLEELFLLHAQFKSTILQNKPRTRTRSTETTAARLNRADELHDELVPHQSEIILTLHARFKAVQTQNISFSHISELSKDFIWNCSFLSTFWLRKRISPTLLLCSSLTLINRLTSAHDQTHLSDWFLLKRAHDATAASDSSAGKAQVCFLTCRSPQVAVSPGLHFTDNLIKCSDQNRTNRVSSSCTQLCNSPVR